MYASLPPPPRKNNTRLTLLHCLLALLTLTFTPTIVQAACTSPTGVEGDVRYDSPAKKMFFCDNTNWVQLSSGVSASSANMALSFYCYTSSDSFCSDSTWRASTLSQANLVYTLCMATPALGTRTCTATCPVGTTVHRASAEAVSTDDTVNISSTTTTSATGGLAGGSGNDSARVSLLCK